MRLVLCHKPLYSFWPLKTNVHDGSLKALETSQEPLLDPDFHCSCGQKASTVLVDIRPLYTWTWMERGVQHWGEQRQHS